MVSRFTPGRRRINFFKGGGRLKEVNFKLRLVYRVTGYVATGRQIYSTWEEIRGEGEGERERGEVEDVLVCLLMCEPVCVWKRKCNVAQYIGHSITITSEVTTYTQTCHNKHRHTYTAVFSFVSVVDSIHSL